VPGRWDHNSRYHHLLLRIVPPTCNEALDVGCGDGGFARELATRAGNVTAVDVAGDVILRAEAASAGIENIRFVTGDFLRVPLPRDGYDYVSCLAALHHMDLRAAIEKMKDLVRPGGVLAILGLARDRSLSDLGASAIAVATNWVLRVVHRSGPADLPVKDPTMTYGEVRSAARSLLPDATFRRLLLFRYLLVWRKPDDVRRFVPRGAFCR